MIAKRSGDSGSPRCTPVGGVNSVWSTVLVGRAAVGHLNVMQNACAMEDNFLKHAVTVDNIEGILEVQADNEEVGQMLLICH